MKKIKIIVICITFLCTSFFLQITSQASSDGTITRRALVMFAPEDGFNSEATQICAHRMFQRNSIPVIDYVEPTSTTNNNSFLNEISSVFSNADDDDISYLYINAHGDSDGNLYIHGQGTTPYLTTAQLKTRLNTINGHIIIFINSCHAGAAINRGENENESKQLPVDQIILNSFLSSDTGNSKGGELDGNVKYTVFCSSLASQSSWAHHGGGCGIATRAWAYGAGYEVTSNMTGNGQSCSWYADTSNNNIITAEEYNNFTVDWINDFNNGYYPNEINHIMTACYFSANPYFTIFTSDYLLGDIDQDNQIDLADVLLLNKHIANISILSGRSFMLADMDSSNVLNNIDVLQLRNLCMMY